MATIAGAAVVLAACSPSALEAPALRACAQDPAHGLVQRVIADDVEAVCACRPTELLVAQEVNHRSTTPAALDSVRQAFATKSYFSLSLTKSGAEIENQFITDQTTYTHALAYLNTGIAGDVFLVTAAQDSVPALASTYARQYGATGRTTVLLIFDVHRLALSQDFQLVFRGEQFALGILRFPLPRGRPGRRTRVKTPAVIPLPTVAHAAG